MVWFLSLSQTGMRGAGTTGIRQKKKKRAEISFIKQPEI